MARHRVLIVEDEHDIAGLIKHTLERGGDAEAQIVSSGDAALAAVAEQPPDLIILDLNLPVVSGLDVCRVLRSRADLPHVPIIMLTARTSEDDRVVGLELGADDYVTKPFSPRELVARVRAVLRRGGGEEVADLLLLGDLEIDVPAREVRLRGNDVRLAAREFDLLAFLARHPRRVFTREQIMQSVWGYTAAIDTGTLSVHVRRLREKIEDDPRTPRRIETVWNVGYRFVA